jgi:hypothetical protein
VEDRGVGAAEELLDKLLVALLDRAPARRDQPVERLLDDDERLGARALARDERGGEGQVPVRQRVRRAVLGLAQDCVDGSEDGVVLGEGVEVIVEDRLRRWVGGVGGEWVGGWFEWLN